MPRTALLVIDLQRGAFDGVHCKPIDQSDALISSATSLLSVARSSGVPVVLIQHCEANDVMFAEGSPHWALHEAIVPQPGEAVLRKYASSAFEGTGLARMLDDMGVNEVVLCGLQSEFCIANTARSALANGLAVTIAQDGHSTWPSDDLSPADIRQKVNAELEQAGARLRSVASLVRTLPAAQQ